MVTVKNREVPTIEFKYLCDDNFRDDIKEIRDKYNIRTIFLDKENIIPVEEILKFDYKLITNKILVEKYDKDIKFMAIKYGLSGLEEDLKAFVEGDTTPYAYGRKYIRKPHKMFHLKVESDDSGDQYGQPVSVKVSFLVQAKIEREELNKWIDKNSDKIVKQVGKYLKDRDVGITKLTKTERIVEVITLREKYPKYTWEKIADMIAEKHPDDSDSKDGIINAKSCAMIFKRNKIVRKKK